MMFQHFNWVDNTIIGIIAFSTIIGLFRGFVREVISLISWLAALLISLKYAPLAQAYLPLWLASQTLRYVMTFILLFIAIVLFGMFINMIVGFWVNKSSLSISNRLIGIVFGALRGVAIVVLVLFMLMNLGTVKDTTALQVSVLAATFKPFARCLENLLPPYMQALKSLPPSNEKAN